MPQPKILGFPGGSVVKNPPTNAGDAKEVDSISGWGRSPGEGNVSALQYSCLQNPVGREAWQATVHDWAVRTRTSCTRHDWVTKQALIFIPSYHFSHLWVSNVTKWLSCQASTERRCYCYPETSGLVGSGRNYENVPMYTHCHSHQMILKSKILIS